MNDHPELILSIVYLIGTIAIPNNKIFFLWSVSFVLLQIGVAQSFFKGILLTFLPFSLFTIGQAYQFLIIRHQELTSYLYQDGRSLYFTLSPTYVLLIVCILAVPLLVFKLKKSFHLPIGIVLLLLLALFEIISSMKSMIMPTLSLLFVLKDLGLICWAIVLCNFLKSKKNIKKILNIMLWQLAIILIFHSSLTLFQVIKRAPLGLKIEQTDTIPYFGSGADENPNVFRPVGLRSDPNTLANELLILEGTMLMLWLFLTEKKILTVNKNVLFLSCFLVAIALILTQSRSIYLGIGSFGIIIFIFQRQKIFGFFKFALQKLLPYKLTLLCLVFCLLLMVADRLWWSQFSFSDSGGFIVRSQLVQEAISLIQQHYWWGVGTEMFIPAAFQNHPAGVMGYFPEAVHNGFYLFLAEKGIWSMLVVSAFLYWLLRSLILSKTSSLFKWVCVSIQVGLFVAMIFQPIANLLTIFGLLLITLVEVDRHEPSHKKN